MLSLVAVACFLLGWAKDLPSPPCIGGHQCGFRCNRSTTDHIFCTHQILEEKWECNKAVNQLFIDFRKAYNSVRKEVLYILIEFVFPMIPLKLVRLIKVCLTDTYSGVQVGKNLSDMFLIRNGLKQGDALSPNAVQLGFRICLSEGSGKPG
jgi:hypothetical protein